jgi:hypothetical protein
MKRFRKYKTGLFAEAGGFFSGAVNQVMQMVTKDEQEC